MAVVVMKLLAQIMTRLCTCEPVVRSTAAGGCHAGERMSGGVHPAQGLDNGAKASHVGEGRILADPDAVRNAAVEVLGEMAADIRADGCENSARFSVVSGVHSALLFSSEASPACCV